MNLTGLKQDYESKLLKASKHFEYSYKKVLKLPTSPAVLDEEQLETWESFSARFARVADIFLTKYLRVLVLLNDPGFEGSLRDFLDQAEKIKLIESTDQWMKVRELRNINAHDYADDKLEAYFKDLLKMSPLVQKARPQP